MNADYLVYGEVTKVKDTYHINVRIIDVSKSEIIISRIWIRHPDDFKYNTAAGKLYCPV